MIFKLLLTHVVYSVILISKVPIVPIVAIVRIAKEDVFKTLLYFRSYAVQSLKEGIHLLLLLIHAICIILLHSLARTLLLMLVKITLYLPSQLLIRLLQVNVITFLIFLLFRRSISKDMSCMLSIVLLSTQINNSTSSRRIFWLLYLLLPLRQLKGFLELAFLLIYCILLSLKLALLFFLLSIRK